MRSKKVMAKKPAAKKVIAKGKVPVQKYQVGGMAAPARTTATAPAARPVPGGMMSRTFMQRGMTPRSTPRVPAQEQSWMQSGMTPEQRAYVQQLQQQRASRPGMASPVRGGLIPNNSGGTGGSMVANNGAGMMSPPNSRPRPVPMNQPVITPPPRLNIPGITPPMNRPVPPPPPRQGMPQGMSPAMQQYAQMMQQRQGMRAAGGIGGHSGLQGMDPAMQQQYQRQLEQAAQQRQGMPQQGQQQFMQSVRAGAPTAGPTAQVYPAMPQREMSPGTIDLRDPAMAARYGNLLGPQQPLTQEQLQQLQQFGTPLNQAPARFKGGGEAKKKAAAQGRMAKPAGRGRTNKPTVRGRMAKPTRGKK